LEAPRLRSQPARVARFSYLSRSVTTQTGTDEASSENLGSLQLGDRRRLAGQESFVQLEGFVGLNNAIDDDLIAGLHLEQIPDNNFGDLESPRDAIADYSRSRRGQDGKAVEGDLCAQLLPDADESVSYQDQPEHCILDRADHEDCDKQRAEQRVETGQQVRFQDVGHAPAGGLPDRVGQA